MALSWSVSIMAGVTPIANFGCTYIPAHPADAPARTICNNTYPVVEQYGLVWSGEPPEHTGPTLSTVVTSAVTPIRALIVNAPLHRVALPLIGACTLQKTLQFNSAYGAHTPGPFTITLHTASSGINSLAPDVAFFLQPIDSTRTATRGILCSVDDHCIARSDITQLLRRHQHTLNGIRHHIESHVASEPVPPLWTPAIPSVSESNASLPPLKASSNRFRRPWNKPVVDQDDVEKVAADETLSDGDPAGISWLVKGVDTKLPK